MSKNSFIGQFILMGESVLNLRDILLTFNYPPVPEQENSATRLHLKGNLTSNSQDYDHVAQSTITLHAIHAKMPCTDRYFSPLVISKPCPFQGTNN